MIRAPFARLSFLSLFHHSISTFSRLPARFFPSAPGAPILIPEECSAENNSVTVAWQPPPGHGIVGCAGQRGPAIEGYLLELDDGCGGEFRVNQRFFERGRNVLLPRKGERERERKSNRNFGWISKFDRLIYI